MWDFGFLLQIRIKINCEIVPLFPKILKPDRAKLPFFHWNTKTNENNKKIKQQKNKQSYKMHFLKFYKRKHIEDK